MPAHLTEAEFAKLKGATPLPATADTFHQGERERRLAERHHMAAERHALDCQLKRVRLAKLTGPVADKLPRRVGIAAQARRPHWHGAALAFLAPVVIASLLHFI